MFYLTIHKIFVSLYLQGLMWLVITISPELLLLLLLLLLFAILKTIGMLKDMKNRKIFGVNLGN